MSLENQLHRVSVMQMEADMVRKKYRSVRASLKSDAAFYVSSLKNLEHSIKEQELEIKQLQVSFYYLINKPINFYGCVIK